MKTPTTRTTLRRIAAMASLLAGLAVTGTPAFAESLTCTSERYNAGGHTMPSYAEAMAQCIANETAMTHPQSGAYRRLRSCHDVGARGSHGVWQHGRVAVDVIDRISGDRYTFEGLWMCKPVVAEAAAGRHRR